MSVSRCECGFYDRGSRHGGFDGGRCIHYELRNLAYGERIVAVVPEECSGPGWANRVVWVYIHKADGGHRVESIQPEEQTPEMKALFEAGAAMHRALLSALPAGGKNG